LFSSSVSSSDSGAFVFDTENDLNNSSNVLSIKENGNEYLDVSGSGTTTIYGDGKFTETADFGTTTVRDKLMVKDNGTNDLVVTGSKFKTLNHITYGNDAPFELRTELNYPVRISPNQKDTLTVDTNQRVGINTTTPAKDLSVSGTSKITGTSTFASTLVANSGKNMVGINTSSPKDTFHIVENKANTAGIRLQNTGTGGGNFTLGATNNQSPVGGGSFIIGDNDANPATTTKFIIDPSGNIGINTTSPDSILEVNGNIQNSSTLFTKVGNNRVGINTSSPVSDFSVSGAMKVTGNSNFNDSLFVDSQENIAVNTTTTKAEDDIYVTPGDDSFAGIRLDNTPSKGGGSFTIGADNSTTPHPNVPDKSFTIFDNDDLTNRFVIDDSGNVGIASNTPRDTLSVEGGATIDGGLDITGALNDPDDILTFQTSGSTAMLVNGSDVGIGTVSPEETFHVDGSVCVTSDDACGTTVNSGEIAAETSLDSGADIAEMYRSIQNLQKGELVKLVDNSTSTQVKRTSNKYDDNLAGVVSTDPGTILSAGMGGYPIALSGRVPTKVNDSGGDIHVGDPITASAADGVGMKADKSAQVVGFALESFTGTGTSTISVYVSPEYRYNENELKVADNGNIGLGTTSPESKLDVEGTAQAELFKSSSSSAMSDLAGGLTVGPKGFVLEGGFTMSSANPSVSSTNKLNFDSTTLFENSVTSSDDYAYIFNTTNQLGISSSTYLMSIRNNDQPQLSVATNGDVHAGGTLFADGLNTNENDPGDLAEEVSIKSGQDVEPGEVLVVDPKQVDTYKRSEKPYSPAIAGVVSTDPSITIGGTQSDNSAVMAMVGRVPTKVTTENGEINRGDLLVSASKPGYAMKYDPSKEIDRNTISSVGIALESFDKSGSSTGKIMTLVKPGWISNYNQSINEVKKNITRVAQAKGINVDGKPSDLTVESSDSGDIEYKQHGNLDLAGSNIVNVSGIRGANNKWSIDTNGRFVTNVDTSEGEKSLYTIQSDDEAYYTFFGTDRLKGGQKEVDFKEFRQDIIDEDYPIQVNVTLKSPANGIYVSESSEKGFTVKETGDGESNAKFDWTVIAQRETSGSDKSVQPHGGCTNPRAKNYDPTATSNDGSCKIVGCVDVKAENYDSTATIGGRIDCVYKEKKVVKGCTAKRADNYNPKANLNDGSCNFAGQSNQKQKDNEPPQLELLGAQEVKLEVGDDYNDPGVELSDNRDNSPKLTKKVDGKEVDSLNIDTTEPGEFKVAYHAEDDAGNENEITRKIIVEEAKEDNGKDPQITLKGNEKITLTTDQKYVEPGAEASDKEDGDITDQIKKLGSVNDNVAGEYSIVYKVTDSDGNNASASRVVTIESVTNTDKKSDSGSGDKSKQQQDTTTSSTKSETTNSSSSTEEKTSTTSQKTSQDSTETTTTQKSSTTTNKQTDQTQKDSETEQQTSDQGSDEAQDPTSTSDKSSEKGSDKQESSSNKDQQTTKSDGTSSSTEKESSSSTSTTTKTTTSTTN
ncbi:MAG: immunoglobulin-like domain-containing protein, partial [Candidatus Paceibacteria bacterium]